jgi:hypothetical protein
MSKESFIFEEDLLDLAMKATNTSELAPGVPATHESMFQSWHLLRLLERLLDAETPPRVALALIDTIRGLGHDLRVHQLKPSMLRFDSGWYAVEHKRDSFVEGVTKEEPFAKPLAKPEEKNIAKAVKRKYTRRKQQSARKGAKRK